MKDIAIRFAALAAPLLIVACGDGVDAAPETTKESEAASAAQDSAPEHAAASEIGADDMVLGDADAPVEIIEYASVTCPGCANFHQTVLPQIREKYVDTGKVKLVFREFPTPPVDFALIGSVVARCASEKGGSDAYFLVIDALLKTQRTWIYGDDPKQELLKIVAQAGMDEAAFDACLERQELVEAIDARVNEGREAFDVSSTPTFILNGEKMKFRNAEEFEALLDAALEKAGE